VDVEIPTVSEGAVDGQGRVPRTYSVRVSNGAGGQLMFDARRCYSASLTMGGRSCLITIPVKSEWANTAKPQTVGSDITLTRALNVRRVREEAAIADLAQQLGASLTSMNVCDAAAIRFRRTVQEDKVRRVASCQGEAYGDIGEDAWLQLADQSDPTKATGLILTSKGLGEQGWDEVQAAINSPSGCRGASGGAPAELIAKGFSFLGAFR
jgi:hypothetical protein